jgi:HlyD family secretion protein
MFQKIKKFLFKHKVLSIIAILLLAYGGYKAYIALTTKAGETQYVLASVEKGTIITAVTGSGQVSASSQVDLKSKASGVVNYIGVKAGDTVKSGTLIASINAADAQKSVRDALVNLQSAKLSLQKLEQPADALSITQAQNSLASAQQTLSQAKDNLTKAYDDALTAISNAFLDFPTIVSGLSDILYKNSYAVGQNNMSYYDDQVKSYNMDVFMYQNSADYDYQAAKNAYDKNFLDYKATSRMADDDTIETLLSETNDTALLISQAVKSSDNFLGFVKDQLSLHIKNLPSLLATHQASTASYTGTVNSNLSSLLNSKNSIKNYKNTITSSESTIKEKTESLASLQAGTDVLDLQSAKLSVQQRQNSVYDAQSTFADYFTRAPFDGVIATVDVSKSDDIGSGAAIATIITKQQMAEITLNEVDVAKVKVGQKATMTFDAIEDLTISGKVAEVDTIGAASQGVVSYGVKISFDTQDDRIKPGMSVNASIITDVRTDVLTVPNSAVKTQNNTSYVEVLDEKATTQVTGTQNVTSVSAPTRQTVTVGISDDNVTEITSGLTEGDKVITKTTTVTAGSASQTTAPSLLQSLGGSRSTGSATRAVQAGPPN